MNNIKLNNALQIMEYCNHHSLLNSNKGFDYDEYTFKGILNLHEIAGFFYDLKGLKEYSKLFDIKDNLEEDVDYTFETFEGVNCTTIFVEHEKKI